MKVLGPLFGPLLGPLFGANAPSISTSEANVREVRTAPAMIVTAAPTVLEVRTAPAIIEVFHG